MERDFVKEYKSEPPLTLTISRGLTPSPLFLQKKYLSERKERIFEKALSYLFMPCGVVPLDPKKWVKISKHQK